MKKIGRYEVVEELGRGAMGIVYKASDPTIGRLVAVKVLSLEKSTEEGVPGARDIFMREARAAGRLSHPGIVTIHDALEDPENETNYIIMEFVPGRTLEKVLLQGPPPTLEHALDIARQIAEALDYAHQQQIIHRDLKPANILLTDEGRAKITDFGIAKIAAREGAIRTVAIMGTPAYMSPEQVTGGEVDSRSDLFSLGILLYLLLTGQKPFAGDTAAVMFKIVYEDPVPPSQVKKELSPGHDYLVLRCLAKNRDRRYSSAKEFLDDLDDVCNGRSPRSEAQVPLSELQSGERTIIARPPGVPGAVVAEGAGRKSRWAVARIAVEVALFVSLGTLVIWWSRHRAAPAGTPAAQSAAPMPTATEATPPATRAGSPPPAAPPPPTKTAETIPNPKRTEGRKPLSPTHKASAEAPAGAGGPAKTIAGPAPTTPPGATKSEKPAEPTASQPVATRASAKLVHLLCKHQLKEGTLTISNGSEVVFRGGLKGKKKSGFMGLKGGYEGTLSRPINLPAGARELLVRVVSSDGSIDLTNKVSAPSSTMATPTLQVLVGHDRMVLNWRAASRTTP